MLRHLVRLLDRRARPERVCSRPAEGDDFTDGWISPWDVRTLIAPGSASGPVQLVFANLLFGRTGIRGFDDRNLQSTPHLVVVLRAGELGAARRIDFPRESISLADGVRIEAPDARYAISGAWPRYRCAYEDDAGCAFDLGLDCTPPLHPWAGALPLYAHYSAFGTSSGEVLLSGQRFHFEGGVSVEHGRGLDLSVYSPYLRAPARYFHYEVQRLEGGDQLAVVTFSFGRGLEAIRRGVYHRRDGSVVHLEDYALSVHELWRAPAREPHARPIEVPRRWEIRARSADGALDLRYEGETLAEPFVGIGRLTSTPARIQAEVTDRGKHLRAEGAGYLEQLSM
jgi:hypothetical protein